MTVNGAVSVGQGSEMPIEELEQTNEAFADPVEGNVLGPGGTAMLAADGSITLLGRGSLCIDHAAVRARISDHLAGTPA